MNSRMEEIDDKPSPATRKWPFDYEDLAMSSFFGESQVGWTDMSDFVVHFAREYGGRSGYQNMLSILGATAVLRLAIPLGSRGIRRLTSTLKESRVSARCRCIGCPAWPRRGPTMGSF